MSRLVCFLLFALALEHCHAQGDRFSMQDGFIFPGPAERPEKFPLNQGGGRLPTTQPSVNPQSTTVSPAVVAECLRNCKATSEYNPVCGTDNVLYSNPGRLSCAQHCTKMPVQIRNYGQCDNNMRG